MPKRKRNDGLPKMVCQHNNTELMTNSDGEPEQFCTDCHKFTGVVYRND